MIIWLASYPKSGNTWIRSIISALLYSNDGDFNFKLLKNIDQFPEKKYFKDSVKDFSDFNEIKKYWILEQDKINLDNEIKLFKTHQGNYNVENDSFTNKENTLAIIYIVRDPRSLVKSISNHYTLSISKALEFLLTPRIIGNGKKWNEDPRGLLNLLGKWNDHYHSWTKYKENLLIIKYEDLVKNPESELLKLVKFLKKYLKFETNDYKNKKILETTTFENLKKMEKRGEFFENAKNKFTKDKVDFFHLGPENKWQDVLDKKIVNEIEKAFCKEMTELGYLK
tara:strand:- start:1045 stop:1890 length:846 start_codon:yes stop_codon:yes gene_type:complete